MKVIADWLIFFENLGVADDEQRCADGERGVSEIEIRNEAQGDEVGYVTENNSFAEIRERSAENQPKRECANFRAFANIFHENISEQTERDKREQDNPNAWKFDAKSEIRIFDELKFQKRQNFLRNN